MSVACPYCHFTMLLKGAKPGRYTPTCQGCNKKFLIIVNAAANQPPTVRTFEEGVAEAEQMRAQERLHKVAAGSGHYTSAVMDTQPLTSIVELPVAKEPTRHAPAPMPKHVHTLTLTGMLGGYLIERKLGEGGMGAVYLAKQVSLDRPVAVKVMNLEWANDATFIARFTREAYAAAQLTHHNIVQIYDIGLEKNIHYFSMEYVPGKTLAQIVRKEVRLDPELAAGYALQAARGLKFAHDHGMIHRDVKPENLLLSEQGIVKVVDLGLVKTPESGDTQSKPWTPGGPGDPAAATQVSVSMGTPAYMSPEQAREAASVDQRADVYSLGCTLYDLVVGRPPFEGRTAMEVLTKHASEPVTPPELVARRVPATLSHIVQKMVAKKKEDRYASMDAVIKELEEFLGIHSTGPFTPREEHATLLEKNVQTFNESPMAMVRRNAIRGAAGFALVVAAVLLMLGAGLWAGAVVGLLVLTPLIYQVVIGVTRKTHVFMRLRQLAFGARLIDWAKFFGFALVAILVLWMFGLLWIWIGVAVVAMLLAVGLAMVIDRMVRSDRKPQVNEVQEMLRSMRLKGLEENALRQFVCKYSGKHWEEFYEVLFGYEAKMQAREAWGRGEGGKSRRKFGAWRDSLIAWADGRMKERQEARERQLLEKLEERSLRAKGAKAAEAREKARASTDWMVTQAMDVRGGKRAQATDSAAPTEPMTKRFDWDPTEEKLQAAKREQARVAAARTPGGSLGMMLLGPHVRLFLGVIAIAVCLVWLHQNDSLHAERLRDWVLNNMQGAYHNVGEPWKEEKIGSTALPDLKLKAKLKPLELPMLGTVFTDKQRWQLFNSLSWGIAGMLLMFSAFWRGVKISLFIIPAAVIMIAGEFLGMPGFMGFEGWQVSYAIGGVLAAMAFWLGRELA